MKFFLSLISAVFILTSGADRTREFYVRVPFDGPMDLKKFAEQGFDVGGVNFETKVATLVVKEEQMPQTRSLNVLGIQGIGRPDSQYKKPADVEKFLRDTEDRYPHLARVEAIGKSVEGRDIWAVEITARLSTGAKESVLFDAMHHAREVMTTEVALDIVDYLTKNYDTDANVRKWVNKYSIWVVPMVNPDGNNKVWNSSSMWRKNTQGGHGVDVNRNYPHAWNTCQGSSGSKSSDTYRGASPGSEPETQALMGLAKRIRPVFNISYHSFSEIVIYPFGCSPQKVQSPDADVYLKVGKELAQKLVRDSGSGTYRPGTSYELLYNVDGGSVDWMYTSDKIMSYVIEVNNDAQGFQPSYGKWRDQTVEKQRPGWQYILDRMEGPGIR